MRIFSYLTAFLITALLAACGGGGGSPGLSSGAAAGALFTTAPSGLTVAVSDNAVTYSISGGVPPYLAVSSNVTVLTASTSGSSGQFLDLKGISSGAASVAISDAKGTVVTLAVTVPAPGALFSTAPSALTIAIGGSSDYLISGGLPFTGSAAPYTAVSSNSSVATASVAANGKLTINAIADGTASVIVSDSKGATLTVQVTVPAPASIFTTAPSPLTLAIGTTSSQFAISGGTPYSDGYRAVSTNASVATVALNATKTAFTMTGVASGATSIVLSDSKGASVTIGVTVAAPTPLTASVPSITIAIGNSGVVTVSGGVPFSDGYHAQSTNVSVAAVTVSNGKYLTIQGVTSGAASIVVVDANGAALNIAVVVPAPSALYINAPGAVSIGVGGAPSTYLIGGGVLPYSAIAVSTDERIVSGAVSGTVLSINGKSSGAATVQVTDAVGTRVALSVTVASLGGAINNYPTLTAGLPDSGTNPTNGIAAAGYTTLSVSLKDPSGRGIPNQPVDVAPDAKLLFPDGNTSLTNASGIATFKVTRASLVATGAGALTISYNYKAGSIATYPDGSTPPAAGQLVTTYLGYQLAAANITLDSNVGAATLGAYGTRQITVTASVNGVASTTPVLVNFSASCGQISPTSASTNSLGQVVVSYSATDAPGTLVSTIGCGGKTVEITASTAGATAVTKQLTVTTAPATNLAFVDATPVRIYLAGSGGATQSIVRFRLTNALGAALLGQDVTLTLKTQTGGAVKATFGSVGNSAAVTSTTDSNGEVSVPVFSGTVPTSVLVNAALVSNPLVQTDSAVLTIASGRPAQARVSLSIEKFAIRGFNFDGASTNVTLSLADRQGNPVPDGTAVNFVTEGGVMIPPVCTTGIVAGNSQCTVTIRTQNPRPANGRVSILAYASGEEDFVDNNFNNVYDAGDTFTDLGNAFRDDDEDGAYNSATDGFTVPRTGSSACLKNGAAAPVSVETGRSGTCDGVWGAADVRKQAVIVFSTDDLTLVSPTWTTAVDATYTGSPNVTTQFDVTLQDLNGNSVPTGSSIGVVASDNSPNGPQIGLLVYGCTLVGQSYTVVPNTLNPLLLNIYLKQCVKGDQITVTVTTPAGIKSLTYTVPN
ncbi:MAG: hypothetical protein WCH60_16055 [Burkholderiales bacterium]